MSDFVVREVTARAPGAVAVLVLSGPGARGAVRALGATPPAPGGLALARLREGGAAGSTGEVLDEALVVARGEDLIELHLHGSTAVVDRIRAELGAPTAPAEAPSLEERAAELLADAPSEVAARILLDQVEGALRGELARLRAADGASARRGLAALAARARAAAVHLVPPRVVLAGPSNAGKSTLFNALVGEQRVLVDASAGTTRDAVRTRVRLGSLVVELVDTAGDRSLAAGRGDRDAEVEAAGQALARRLRASAELVLWLRPADGAADAAPPADLRATVLDSCADRVDGDRRAALARPVAALDDPAGARAAVAAAVAERLGPLEWSPGQAVPFTRALGAELAALADAPEPERAAGLDALLELGR